MKRMALVSLLLALPVLAFSQNAADIVSASRNRIPSGAVSTVSKMVITDANGRTTTRYMYQFTKDFPNGSRTVVAFPESSNGRRLNDSSIANTRFLTIANSGGGTSQRIFLPETRKVTPISSSDGSKPFLGTDFSSDDMSSLNRAANLDTHSLLREEQFSGPFTGGTRACYVIESKPKDSSFQYSRMVQWIDKETLIIYRIELYDQKNVLTKLVEMGNVKEFQGRLTPTMTKGTTVGKGTSTTIEIQTISYDASIPDGVFTDYYLLNGRSQ